jgi:hypothetical protein
VDGESARGGGALSSGRGRNDSPVWSRWLAVAFASDRDRLRQICVKTVDDAAPGGLAPIPVPFRIGKLVA